MLTYSGSLGPAKMYVRLEIHIVTIQCAERHILHKEIRPVSLKSDMVAYAVDDAIKPPASKP